MYEYFVSLFNIGPYDRENISMGGEIFLGGHYMDP